MKLRLIEKISKIQRFCRTLKCHQDQKEYKLKIIYL